MKKALWVRLVVGVIAVTMLLSACGGGTANDSGTAPQQGGAATTPSNNAPAAPAAPAAQDEAPYEFSVAVRRGHVESDSVIQKYFEEKYNVKINLIVVPDTSEAQAKINLLMADPTQRPDVIWYQTAWTKEYTQWRDAGLLVDVSDYYWKYPNIREYYNKVSPDSLFYAAEPDGRLFGVPGDVGEPGHMTNLIRKDWLDHAGLAVPATFDEYVAALRAMQANNPASGSGVYAYAGAGAEMRSLKPFWSYFGVIPDQFIFLDDGSVGYGAVQPEMKEALAFIRELYSEGLIDPNIVLRDLNFNEAFVTGNFGSTYRWIAWLNPEDNTVKSFRANNPTGEYVNLEPFSNPKGNQSDNSISPAAWCAFAITDRAADPERIYAFFDALAGPEDWLIRRYGFEGEHYTYENGLYTPILTEDENAAQNIGRNIFDTFVNRKDEYNITNTPEVAALFARGTQLVQPDLKRICYVKTPDRPVWSEHRADLEALRDEYIWGIIAGQRPLDDFDTFAEHFLTRGGKDAEEETARLMAQQTSDYASFQENFRP